jgi:hypothetical protein
MQDKSKMKVFSQGGDVGDLIYSLASVKTLGGGRLRLVKTNYVRESFSPEKVELLRPFLENQPYVTGVEYSQVHTGINLDEFRKSRLNNLSLCDRVATALKIPHYPRDEPWLSCDSPNRIAPVVIARSSRYHSNKCPWPQIWNRYSTKAIFVGLREEYEDWRNRFGSIDYYPTKDWWELCRVIAGAQLFIGNQSAPMALAIGLCVPKIIQEVCLECPNCHFKRSGIYYFPDHPLGSRTKGMELPNI